MSRSLTELLHLLELEHDDTYVYRGQTHSHDVIIPSALRGATAVVDGPVHHLSRKRLVAARTRRAREQQHFGHYLIHRFGAGMGSILAQQFLVSSTVIDITSSPTVAGFFASRRWPTYEQVTHGAGRIYRWRKPDPRRSTRELVGDAVVGRLLPAGADDDDWRPATATAAQPGSKQSHLPRDEPDAVVVYPTAMFSFDEILASVVELSSVFGEDHWGLGPMAGIERSRWAAQRGGFLRPWIRFPAHIGRSPEEGFRLVDRPDLDGPVLNHSPLIGLPDAVADAAQLSCEVFEFDHSDASVAISPESLWPPVSVDPLFQYVAALAWTTHGAYFDDTLANTPWDQQCGIIDRGHYPIDSSAQFDTTTWKDVERHDRDAFDEFRDFRRNQNPELWDDLTNARVKPDATTSPHDPA